MKELLITASVLLIFVIIYLVIRRLDLLIDTGRKNRQNRKKSRILSRERK